MRTWRLRSHGPSQTALRLVLRAKWACSEGWALSVFFFLKLLLYTPELNGLFSKNLDISIVLLR